MGIDIYTQDEGTEYQNCVLACNTSDVAFGPVMYATPKKVRAFLQWLPQNARRYEDDELRELWYEFLEATE